MFYPKPPFDNIHRALLISPIPEWHFFSGKLSSEHTQKWLIFNLKRATEGSYIIGPLFGSPQLAFLLEILISKGLKELIFIGWGGRTPRASLPLGSLLLPYRAISLSGTTRFYWKNRKIFTINKLFSKIIEEKLKKFSITYERGVVLTVDAPIQVERELERYNFYLNQTEVMDMETATLYAMSEYHGFKACAFIMVTDETGKLSHSRSEGLLKRQREELLPLLRVFVEEGFLRENEKIQGQSL